MKRCCPRHHMLVDCFHPYSHRSSAVRGCLYVRTAPLAFPARRNNRTDLVPQTSPFIHTLSDALMRQRSAVIAERCKDNLSPSRLPVERHRAATDVDSGRQRRCSFRDRDAERAWRPCFPRPRSVRRELAAHCPSTRCHRRGLDELTIECPLLFYCSIEAPIFAWSLCSVTSRLNPSRALDVVSRSVTLRYDNRRSLFCVVRRIRFCSCRHVIEILFAECSDACKSAYRPR